MSGAPPGVNMPKKKDPRLRGVQQPQQNQFFDSADYEVRKQRLAQPQPQLPTSQQHHQSQQRNAPPQSQSREGGHPADRRVPPPPPPPSSTAD